MRVLSGKVIYQKVVINKAILYSERVNSSRNSFKFRNLCKAFLLANLLKDYASSSSQSSMQIE